MSTRSTIFTNEIPGLPVSFVDLKNTQNNIYFVDSSHSSASDSSGYGSSPNIPFATIDYAIGVMSNKDVLYVMPGHSESGISITVDVENIKIIGLGNGSNRPTLNFSATGNKITISADDVILENILLLTGIDSVVNKVTISGNGCKIKNCEFKDVTDIETITDLIISGDDCTIDGFIKNGYTGGNANDCVVSADGVNNLKIKNCDFYTKVATAVIEFVTTLSTQVMIKNCNFLVSGTTDLSKNVVDTITSSVWGVDVSCFDIGAGANFNGGSGNALAILPRA